jgi:SAM-dependent methyltransferase
VALARQYVKRCDIADFEDPVLLDAMRELIPDRDPVEFAERKVWEYAQLVLFLRETGHLTEATEALAVGAGDERAVFWLANHAGKVVATDIYGEGEFADTEGSASMLADPRSRAPFAYRADHLEVRWMDGRHLDYPDASFDVVFSLSAIEHFGTTRDIARAAREMGRVLRPGGHAFITTDCYVTRSPLNSVPVDLLIKVATAGRLRSGASLHRRAGVDALTLREVERHIVDASGLRLLQPLDLTISPASFENVARAHRDGRVEPQTGRLWPHVVLEFRRSRWTSIALAFEKD